MDDLHKKTDIELTTLLKEKRGALKNFRFGLAGSKVRNLKEGSMIRKEIARILGQFSVRKNATISKNSQNKSLDIVETSK